MTSPLCPRRRRKDVLPVAEAKTQALLDGLAAAGEVPVGLVGLTNAFVIDVTNKALFCLETQVGACLWPAPPPLPSPECMPCALRSGCTGRLHTKECLSRQAGNPSVCLLPAACRLQEMELLGQMVAQQAPHAGPEGLQLATPLQKLFGGVMGEVFFSQMAGHPLRLVGRPCDATHRGRLASAGLTAGGHDSPGSKQPAQVGGPHGTCLSLPASS
jgi:hypothetical protein